MFGNRGRARPPEHAKKRSVCVTLTCGCQVLARSTPMNKRTTYPCPSNAGHGYNLLWIRWRDDGRVGENPDVGDK